MDLLDNLKTKLAPAKDRVSDLAQRYGDKAERGLDKAAKAVDDKTKGKYSKYSEKIRVGTGKAKGAVERLAHRDNGSAGGSKTPPDVPQPPSRS